MAPYFLTLKQKESRPTSKRGGHVDRRSLRSHKLADKVLSELPDFKPLKRNTLPGQYKRLGARPRVYATTPKDVSEDHSVFFLWRDGEVMTDRHFYGYFIKKMPHGKFLTLLELHWHPSHKGFHCVTPCETDLDYTGRMLSRCKELALTTKPHLDPSVDQHRLELINLFCDICGIRRTSPTDTISADLWN